MKKNNVKRIKSIAVLRLAALGDICMTIPLLCSLRKHFPEAKIHWIISKNMTPLAEGLEGVNFIRLDKPYSLKGYWQCYRQLKNYQFDVLLVPQASLRSNLLCPFIKAKEKYGYGKLHSRDLQRLFVNKTVPAVSEHLVDSFLRFSQAIGAPKEQPEWDIPLSATDQEWAKDKLSSLPSPIIAVCPTTSKQERNWCDQRHVETLLHLKKNWNASILLVGDNGEISVRSSTAIAAGLDQQCLNLTGKSNVKRLAALLQRCDLLIAPDTGPAHIANAVGTPVIGLYAVAPPEKTGPYFSIPWAVNKFPEAVATILKKELDTVSWRQRVHTQDAMLLIHTQDVIKKCEALLTTLQFNPKRK